MAPTAIEITSEQLPSPQKDTGFHSAKQAVVNNGVSSPQPRLLDASTLLFVRNQSPKVVPEPESEAVQACNVCTDHMITAKWTAAAGWDRPKLEPYGPLSLMPTASCLHYATECFEGLKLYRGFDGRLRLFRPECNAKRLRQSAKRIALPDFEPDEVLRLIVNLCAVDGPKWLPPSRPGQFLYLRPTMIGTGDHLGVQKPREALLYVILCCFPSLDKSQVALGEAPPKNGHTTEKRGPGLKLLASKEDTVRAWPGGFGFAKLGSNYGPSLVTQAEAKEKGLDQVLWLLGKERYVTEAGASNFFVVWRTRHGQLQLITAPLDSKIILEGVTRASVLQLARERLGSITDSATTTRASNQNGLTPLEVVEREFTIHEVETAVEEGRLIEAFAVGTAFFVSPVSLIRYGEKDLDIPMGGVNGVGYAATFKKWLWNIMYGVDLHEWGLTVDEE